MRKIFYILAIASLMGLSACQKDEPQMLPIDGGEGLVSLNAQIGEGADTRSPYETLAYPFEVAVWASTGPNYGVSTRAYTNTGLDGTSTSSYKVDRHLSAVFNQNNTILNGPASGGIRYPLYYDETTPVNPTVYFVGLYPDDGWTTTNGTQAIHTFTGKEDLMYAKEVSSNGDPAHHETYGDPTLTFYHLLTYLKFKIEAVEGGAQDAWGKIHSLTLTTTKNIVTTKLTDDTPSFTGNDSGTVTFTNNTGDVPIDIQLFHIGGEIPFPSIYYNIPTTATEVAYVLAAPVMASNAVGTYEYELKVTTDNRSNVSVLVDLKDADTSAFSGSTMGKEFTVTLRFTRNRITAMAQVTPWNVGGMGIGSVVEEE